MRIHSTVSRCALRWACVASLIRSSLRIAAVFIAQHTSVQTVQLDATAARKTTRPDQLKTTLSILWALFPNEVDSVREIDQKAMPDDGQAANSIWGNQSRWTHGRLGYQKS